MIQTQIANLCDQLEELLSITERFLYTMNKDDQKTWRDISAKTADLRLTLDGGDPDDV